MRVGIRAGFYEVRSEKPCLMPYGRNSRIGATMIIDYYYTDDNGNDFLIREFDRMNYTLFSAENHSFTYHDTMRSATIANEPSAA